MTTNDPKQSEANVWEESTFCLHESDTFLFPFGHEELYSDEYLKWMNDPQITRTIGRFDYLLPVDRGKLVGYFNSLDRTTSAFLAIYVGQDEGALTTTKAGKKFIGTLKIYDIDPLAQRAALGIAIGDRSEWGKGYASKAIRIACRYIFEVLGMRKITAGYIAGNTGIERAFAKNGFEVEAVFREHLFFEGQFVDHKFVCLFRNR